MASGKDLKELQFSVASDTRQKIDGLVVFETGSTEDMDNASNLGGKRDRQCLQPKPKCNVRKSLAWDSAFFTSPGVLDPEELCQTLNLLGNEKKKMVTSEALEAEWTSGIGRCSLRKSLAWDSAFFTSAGVLEPEELSMINQGFRKFELDPLPGIEEKLWKSVESISTAASDGSPLRSLEIDLFDDIRASQQKSTQISNVATSISNCQSRNRLNNIHSSQKVVAPSQVRISRGKQVARHGLERVTSEASVAPQSQPDAGTGEYNPKCAARTGELNPKHAARDGELHLSLSRKPPKMSGRASRISTALTERVFLGTKHGKWETQTVKTTSGHCGTVPKKPCSGVSSHGIRSSITSPPSSLLRSPIATNETTEINETTICISPSSRFRGSAVGTAYKSPLRENATDHVNLVATGSTFETPPKYRTTNRAHLEDSNDHTSLLYISKSSSCTSPVSSCGGCSLALLSTSINQGLNNPMASSGTTVEFHPHDERNVGSGSWKRGSPVQIVDKSSAEISSGPSDVSRNAKPSCLRRPSPKIGFFDAENPTEPATDPGLPIHSGVQRTSSKSKTGNNLDRAAKNTEHGKLQPPRTKGTKNMMMSSQTTRVSSPALFIRPSYPVQFGEAEKGFGVGTASRGPSKDHLATTSRAQNNLFCKMSGKDCLKTPNVGNERHDAPELGPRFTSNIQDKGNQGFMSRIGAKCDDQGCQKAKNRYSKHEHARIQSPETNLHREGEKENMYGIRKRVESLGRGIGARYLKSVVIKIREKKGPSLGARNQ